MATDTICGIPIEAFAQPPTPEELGRIVAGWADDDQAEFLICFANRLHDYCGFSDEAQIDWIAKTLVKTECRILDGKGSQLVKKLAEFICDEEKIKGIDNGEI